MSLDIDAALGGHQQPDARGFAVDGQADIGFVREVDALFDAEAVDRLAVERRVPSSVAMMRATSSREAALSTAAGLAAAAAGDLRLHHHRAVRESGGAHIAARRHEHARRNGNAVRRQQLLAVMLDQKHLRET